MSHNTLGGGLAADTAWYNFFSDPIIPNQWYHAAFVKDMESETVAFYLDGTLVGQSSFPASGIGIWNSQFCDQSKMKIGMYSSSNWATNKFDGLIDEAAIFNTALNLAQIQQIYAQGLPRYMVVEH